VIYPEICDDGPANHNTPYSLTGCLPNCFGSDSKWNCVGGNLVSRSSCSPKCGDGIKVGNETCDAGSGPGCLTDCSGVKIGYTCNGASPDVCSPICGDG